MAAFIEDEAAAAGVEMALPPHDLAELSRAATDGLFQYAAVDRERADEYDRLVEKLFELLSAHETSTAAARLATEIASRPRRAVTESKRRVLLERSTLYGFLFEDEERMFRRALGTG